MILKLKGKWQHLADEKLVTDMQEGSQQSQLLATNQSDASFLLSVGASLLGQPQLFASYFRMTKLRSYTAIPTSTIIVKPLGRRYSSHDSWLIYLQTFLFQSLQSLGTIL